jgi:hypothetical protein
VANFYNKINNLAMSIIKLPTRFEGSKNQKTMPSLFDNQVALSCINAADAIKIAELTPLRKPKTVLISDELIEANFVCLLDFYINEQLFSDEFLVVPNLQEAVIFGATTIRKWRIELDYQRDTVDAKKVHHRI